MGRNLVMVCWAAAIAGCGDTAFTFTLEVSGLTDENLTVDGVPQTASAGKVVIAREFDSYDDARSKPSAIAVVVEKTGQAIVSRSFQPGLSCSSKSVAWETESATIELGGTAPIISCECLADNTRLFGTCDEPQ